MKQQLSEALEELSNRPGAPWAEVDPSIAEAIAAARLVERLLPGECARCDGAGVHAYIDHAAIETGESAFVSCHACLGSGRVWDEGIVEAVAKALYLRKRPYGGDENNTEALLSWYGDEVRAVLSALVELLTEKVET